ncbi:hypothetical protein ASG57_34455 [Bradyrhizobium sp. Leaf396]|nr:hypothetical protein ASG57_34455 [Bradyrhizobium sp. Leaf396]
MFEWLKRYRECGAECHVSARRCTAKAIHPLGQIISTKTSAALEKRASRRQPLPQPAPTLPS